MTQRPRIRFMPTPAATELRLEIGGRFVPVTAWPLSGHPGADLCQRLLLDADAIEGEDVLLVEHTAIARLTATEATKLDLPPATSLRAVVEGQGIMMRPDFTVSLRWTRPGGQNVLGIARVGVWVQELDG
jgi:hypothetical protein